MIAAFGLATLASGANLLAIIFQVPAVFSAALLAALVAADVTACEASP